MTSTHGIDVKEGKYKVILIHLVARKLAIDYPSEDTGSIPIQ